MTPFHIDAPEKVAERFDTSSTAGLTQKEAKKRLRYFGHNDIYYIREPKPIGKLFRLLASPATLFFLVAALAAATEKLSGAGLAAAVWLAGTAALAVLAVHAERVLSSVRALGVPRARVIRHGEVRLIDCRLVVPGDLLLLGEGDIVTADCRLIYAEELKVREPFGTDGHRVADKTADACPTAIAPSEMLNMVYATSTVTHGGGRAIVTATGCETSIVADRGGAPVALSDAAPFGAVEKLKRTGKILALIYAAVLIVFSAVLLIAHPARPLGYFLIAAGLAAFWLIAAPSVFADFAVCRICHNIAGAKRGRAFVKNPAAMDAMCGADILLCAEAFAEPYLNSLADAAARYGMRLFVTARTETAASLAIACGGMCCSTPEEACERGGSAPVIVVCRSPNDRAGLPTLLTAAGHTCLAVASRPGHIGMFKASSVAFCCSALTLPKGKLTDLTLADIDRTAGNEAMMKNADVLCEPTDTAVLSAVGMARGGARRLLHMEGYALSAASAMLLMLPLTLFARTPVATALSGVLTAFPVLFLALFSLAAGQGSALDAPSRAERRAMTVFSVASALLWMLSTLGCRIFAERLDVSFENSFAAYTSASLMLFCGFSALCYGKGRRNGALRLLPMLAAFALLSAAAFFPRLGTYLCPGLNRYILLLSAVPALFSAALTAINRSVYIKTKIRQK